MKQCRTFFCEIVSQIKNYTTNALAKQQRHEERKGKKHTHENIDS